MKTTSKSPKETATQDKQGTTELGDENPTLPLPKALVDWEERLSRLEEKFELRGYNTQPMYEVHEERIQSLQVQLGKLEARIESLSKKAQSDPKDLVFRDRMYWAGGDMIPFCPHCFEGKQLRIHLQPAANPGQHWCTSCKNWYEDKTFKHHESIEPIGFRLSDDDDGY